MDSTVLTSFYQVSSFAEFYEKLLSCDNNVKGYVFEDFSQHYFFIQGYEEYYKLEETPSFILEELDLPERDMGIDAIIKDKNKYISVQVKFRSKDVLSHTELSTYISLDRYSGKFSRGIVITSAKEVGKYIRRDEFSIVNYSSLERDCNEEFWKNLRKRISKEPQRYLPKFPFPFQQEIVDKTLNYFISFSKGKILAACGSGKTLLAFWIAQRINRFPVLIIVPSLVLLGQTYNRWRREFLARGICMEFVKVGSDTDAREEKDFILTTKKEEINNSKASVFISTYNSASQLENKHFSLIIYDEAHHIRSEADTFYNRSLFLSSDYKLFMTATGEEMQDEEKFGQIIHHYPIKRAIKDKRLCDYRIIACYANEFTEHIEKNLLVNTEEAIVSSRLYKVASMISNAIEELKLKHLILYSNKTETAKIILKLIQADGFYKKVLTGEEKGRKRRSILESFEREEKAIISSVNVIREGLDITNCDSICFVENRNFFIDIIQCVGRCLRKSKEKEKIGYILVPLVAEEEDFFSQKSNEYKNICNVLRCLYTEDKYVENKLVIKALKVSNLRHEYKRYIKQGVDIDLQRFRQDILIRVFSKGGRLQDNNRLLLRKENRKRYKENQELLISKKDCEEYLGKQLAHKDHWLRYCLSGKIYGKLTKRYYNKLEEFMEACRNLRITNVTNYKEKYTKDEKLPSLELINTGIYYTLDNNFNLSKLLTTDEWF